MPTLPMLLTACSSSKTRLRPLSKENIVRVLCHRLNFNEIKVLLMAYAEDFMSNQRNYLITGILKTC